MNLCFQTRWFRLTLELKPPWPAIRRYRVGPAPLESRLRRLLQRRITATFHGPGPSD